MRLTQKELVEKAAERFGDNPDNWAFQCPNCQDVATLEDFDQAFADRQKQNDLMAGGHPEPHQIAGQECIGRWLGALKTTQDEWTGRGCDWVAYGLFKGPWTIVMADGHEIYGFPLAPAPEDKPSTGETDTEETNEQA